MFPLIPKRFTIRTMLILVALGAVAGFILRNYVRVRNAREDFRWKNALWESGNTTLEEIISASETLASAEAQSSWISKQAAIKRHIEFLNRLLAYLDSGIVESGPRFIERWRQQVHENIRKHS